jgi:hypothetical protein
MSMESSKEIDEAKEILLTLGVDLLSDSVQLSRWALPFPSLPSSFPWPCASRCDFLLLLLLLLLFYFDILCVPIQCTNPGPDEGIEEKELKALVTILESDTHWTRLHIAGGPPFSTEALLASREILAVFNHAHTHFCDLRSFFWGGEMGFFFLRQSDQPSWGGRDCPLAQGEHQSAGARSGG